MDPADEFFAALDSRSRDPRRFERAVAGIRHLLERAANTVFQRSPSLAASAKIEVDDLIQELAHKLFRDPPTSRGRAEAVIVGWAKVVAKNHLIDLGAKADRETGGVPDLPIDRDADRSFDAKLAFRQLERCAEELSDRYRRAYELLREDAEMSRIEIARRLDMISGEDDAALKKAQTNAWAIVSRVRARLAECLDRNGMLSMLPDTLARLRSRRTTS